MDNNITNSDFYLMMTEYLSEGKAMREIFTSSDYMQQFRVTKYFEECKDRKFDDVLPEIIRNLESRGFLSERRHNQFCIVKKVADRRAGVEAEELFKLLFATYREFLWSDTAGSVLFDHYGEIIRVIMNKYINVQTDVAQFVKEALPEVLSGCIMNNLDSCGIIAYRGEEELWVFHGSDETISDNEISEQTVEDEEDIDDEYLKEPRFIHCYIIPPDVRKPQSFLSSKEVFEIPADLIADDDVRPEDLVTLVDDENGNSVTYQVLGKIEVQNDTGVFAYKAIGLPYPILRKEDIEQYFL